MRSVVAGGIVVIESEMTLFLQTKLPQTFFGGDRLTDYKSCGTE
jgi:hypothetical protein